jgi:hypothetical protein
MSTAITSPCCQLPWGTPGCGITHYAYDDGAEVERLPYGHDAEHWLELGIIPPERCRDCGVKLGGYHHPECCIERCPRCHGQQLCCGC